MTEVDAYRGETIGGEPAFLTHEGVQMNAVVNRWRREHGLPLVSLAEVLRLERQAAGHIDYAEKYALYCAELAVGVREREG